MKIPKRITPDHLKHTIVQLIYDSAVHPELSMGIFAHEFKNIFSFVSSIAVKTRVDDKTNLVENTIQRGYFLDISERVKVDVTGTSIVFNSQSDYIGWDAYFQIITQSVEKLFACKMISRITRIGIRYVSEFSDVDLTQNIQLSLLLPSVGQEKLFSQIRTEFQEDPFKVILTLINNQPPADVQNDPLISIIDIDVIQFFNDLTDPNHTLEQIDLGHQKQKTTFFSMLKPDFLNSLNPEY